MICQKLVTRRTGTGTPLSPVNSLERCSLPVRHLAVDEAGIAIVVACQRHRDIVSSFIEAVEGLVYRSA